MIPLSAPPPTEDSTPLPATAAAPSPATAASSGENAAAHNSDNNTGGGVPRKPRALPLAARSTHARTAACIRPISAR